MDIYIYIYTYINTYICIYICVCVYVYAYACVCVHIEYIYRRLPQSHFKKHVGLTRARVNPIYIALRITAAAVFLTSSAAVCFMSGCILCDSFMLARSLTTGGGGANPCDFFFLILHTYNSHHKS